MKQHRIFAASLLAMTIGSLSLGCSPEVLNQLTSLSQKANSNLDKQLATKDPTGKTDPTGTTASKDFVTLKGQIKLPAGVHPVNLYSKYLNPGKGGADHGMHHGGFAAKAALTPLPTQARPPLSRLIKVSAVPILPPAGDKTSYALETDDGSVDIADGSFQGTIDNNGNFEIQVPAYAHGYQILASADKIQLKCRLAEAIKKDKSYENLVVDLNSTLLNDAARFLPDQGHNLSNTELETKLGNALTQKAQSFLTSLQSPIKRTAWKKIGAEVAQASSFGTKATTYTTSDKPVFNLSLTSEMPSSATTLAFGDSSKDGRLNTQYATSDGVRFTPYPLLTTSMTTGLPTITPAKLSKIRVRQTGGYVVVTPTGSSTSDSGLTINFHRDSYATTGVKSIGFNVENGSSPGSSTTRRPFRVIALDEYDAEIDQFHWYTYQTSGGSFYGLTSDTPIHKVRVVVRDGSTSSFMIDNLTYSTDYKDMSSTLGWRSSGAFTLTSAAAVAAFDHMSRGTTATGDYSSNYSGGNHWVASHSTGTVQESILTAPAYTLTNIDLDPDDLTSFDVWAIGWKPGTDNGDGTWSNPTTTDTTIAQCTIPDSRCSFSYTHPTTGLPVTWNLGLHSATAQTHWSHVHWQAYLELEDTDAQYKNTGTTSRFVEYSTDNGATWRNAWWYRDENHHGSNGKWWNNHMHPFMDSYLNGDSDRDGTIENADFNKDGAADTNYDWDQDGTLPLAGDTDDYREWDTEFYMEYIDPPADSASGTDRWGGYNTTYIEGTSVLYRFRLATDGTKTATWKLDDIAFNNDDIWVGYYTNFDETTVP